MAIDRQQHDTMGLHRIGEIPTEIRSAVDQLCREIIGALYARSRRTFDENALLGLFTRIAGSWDSLCALVGTSRNDMHLQARAHDCAAILRCMYDAYIQLAYIAVSPEEEQLGELYCEFVHVERFKVSTEAVKQENAMARMVANSPMRAEGEPRNRREFDRVKHLYIKPKPKDADDTRGKWYRLSNLRQVAEKIGRGDDYVWFVKRYGSSVHSGPFAVFHGPQCADARIIEGLALHYVCLAAKNVVQKCQLPFSERSQALVRGGSIDMVNSLETPVDT